MLRSIALLASFHAVLAALPAAAQPAPAPAERTGELQAIVDEATALFEQRRYDEALERYRAAHSRGGPAVLLYMEGRCYQELERWKEARDTFRAFLALDGVPDEARGRASMALAAVEQRLVEARVAFRVAPLGARVYVDGRLVGQAPLAPVALTPGSHAVRLEAPGHQVKTLTVEALAGQEIEVVETLAVASLGDAPAAPGAAPAAGPPPAPEAAVEAGSSSRFSPWSWVLLGTGAAVAAGGTASFLLGEADHSQVVSATGYSGDGVVEMTEARARSLDSSGDTKKAVGYALWGVGGAAVATSIVLLVLDATSDEPRRGVSVGAGAAPLPGGGAFTLGGSF